MKEAKQERRCLKCKKKLIDEKVPICPRCALEGTGAVKKAGKVAAGAAAGIAAFAAASTIFGNKKDDQEDNQAQDNEPD